MNDTFPTWLRDLILGGEPAAWPILAAGKAADGTSVPAELMALAGAADDVDPAQLAAWSAGLRRLCTRHPTASASVVLGAVSVLRLSSLGHDDPEWSKLMPRWLVPSLAAEVRGLGLLALALNGRETLGADEYADLMDEAIRLLPPTSPLRSAHLYQYALYLSLRGMLRRIADVVDLPRPGDQEPEVDASLLAECFYDAVCSGRTGQAAFLERRLQQSPGSAWHPELFQLHRGFIPVFDAVLNRLPLPLTEDVPSAALIRALLEGDRDVLDSFTTGSSEGEISPLLSLDALRVTISRNDHQAARTLLNQRAAGIAGHWLDDFFLARLLLQEDKTAEAGAAFARVEASAVRYGALERLEIELRLAHELSLHDCCRLGMLASASVRRPAAAAAARPSVDDGAADLALLAGGTSEASGLRQSLEAIVQAPPDRLLILGADDGSRRTFAALIHRGLGIPGQLRRIGAGGWPDAAWIERCRRALDEPGLLLIDEVDGLTPGVQAELAGLLQAGMACRVIVGATPALPAAVAQGRWRQDLYWPLAEVRLTVPAVDARNSDVPEMVVALLAARGLRLRWEATARFVLGKHRLPGGWVQVQALASALGRRCTYGIIDRPALDETMASLFAGYPVEGG